MFIRKIDSMMILLIVLACIGGPVLALILGELVGSAAGLGLSMVIIVAGVCLLRPSWYMPPLVIAAMMLCEWGMLAAGHRNMNGVSIVHAIFYNGGWAYLFVPAAACVAGWLMVLMRKKIALGRTTFRTNLHILNSRSGLFFRKYWPGILWVFIGAMLDTLTTINFMNLYGTEGELHPAMRMMSEEFGVVTGVCVGTLVRLTFVIFVAAIWRGWTWTILWICGLLYCLAAASNHFQWLVF